MNEARLYLLVIRLFVVKFSAPIPITEYATEFQHFNCTRNCNTCPLTCMVIKTLILVCPCVCLSVTDVISSTRDWVRMCENAISLTYYVAVIAQQGFHLQDYIIGAHLC